MLNELSKQDLKNVIGGELSEPRPKPPISPCIPNPLQHLPKPYVPVK
jgi:bacteriocin-like protein